MVWQANQIPTGPFKGTSGQLQPLFTWKTTLHQNSASEFLLKVSLMKAWHSNRLEGWNYLISSGLLLIRGSPGFFRSVPVNYYPCLVLSFVLETGKKERRCASFSTTLLFNKWWKRKWDGHSHPCLPCGQMGHQHGWILQAHGCNRDGLCYVCTYDRKKQFLHKYPAPPPIFYFYLRSLLGKGGI